MNSVNREPQIHSKSTEGLKTKPKENMGSTSSITEGKCTGKTTNRYQVRKGAASKNSSAVRRVY